MRAIHRAFRTWAGSIGAHKTETQTVSPGSPAAKTSSRACGPKRRRVHRVATGGARSNRSSSRRQRCLRAEPRASAQPGGCSTPGAAQARGRPMEWRVRRSRGPLRTRLRPEPRRGYVQPRRCAALDSEASCGRSRTSPSMSSHGLPPRLVTRSSSARREHTPAPSRLRSGQLDRPANHSSHME